MIYSDYSKNGTGASNSGTSSFALTPDSHGLPPLRDLSSGPDLNVISKVLGGMGAGGALGFGSPNMFPSDSAGNSSGSGKIPVHKELSKECKKQLQALAEEINCSEHDLEAIIYRESSGDPTAVNPTSGATGLFQALPSTAADIGTSVEELRNMSPEQQIPYFRKYMLKTLKQRGFKPGEKLDSGTLYALVFRPASARKQVICRTGSKAFHDNPGLGNSEMITKDDLARRLQSYA